MEAAASLRIYLAELSCQEDANQGSNNEPQRKKKQKNTERVQKDLLFQSQSSCLFL